jgi:hypothetical protein
LSAAPSRSRVRLGADQPERRQTGLLRAEHVAGAAQAEIDLGDGEAVIVAADGVEALFGGLAQRRLPEQYARALFVAPAHAAAQLVQLSQAESARRARSR